ncbi:nucleotidyl transferase AbiEii/AbiGii toxin family protein [Halomonas alkalicola]|uniref:nucleotidyl transferase AbiEii/AbiGii toxin family protein n=1 Tax=Halomonas alkalicola TaxID=1930622 RepID=UPI0035EE4216
MSIEARYHEQVRLLVALLPFLNDEPCFALKGGTAINLFVQPFPRLSVDIDLAIATAILDRLLYHSHSTTLNIKGVSYRMKDKRRAGLVTTPMTKEDETSYALDSVPMSAGL